MYYTYGASEPYLCTYQLYIIWLILSKWQKIFIPESDVLLERKRLRAWAWAAGDMAISRLASASTCTSGTSSTSMVGCSVGALICIGRVWLTTWGLAGVGFRLGDFTKPFPPPVVFVPSSSLPLVWWLRVVTEYTPTPLRVLGWCIAVPAVALFAMRTTVTRKVCWNWQVIHYELFIDRSCYIDNFQTIINRLIIGWHVALYTRSELPICRDCNLKLCRIYHCKERHPIIAPIKSLVNKKI